MHLLQQQRRLASDGVEFSQIPTSRTVILEENKSVSKLLSDVRDMKRDQDSMSTKLLGLKRENEALWREYASMRQKFSKQQQIIEKVNTLSKSFIYKNLYVFMHACVCVCPQYNKCYTYSL